MGAGDGLHLAAIAQTQAFAVNILEACRIGLAVVGDRNVFVLTQGAGHGTGPHRLALQSGCHVAVNIAQKAQRKVRVGGGRRDEFEQGFRVIGRDPRVRQLGAQRQRVWRLRQLAGSVNAQAFTLKAARDATQYLSLIVGKKLLDGVTAGELQHERWLSQIWRDGPQYGSFWNVVR